MRFRTLTRAEQSMPKNCVLFSVAKVGLMTKSGMGLSKKLTKTETERLSYLNLFK